MILEVSSENLRDIAAAVHAARKRAPEIEILGELERVVLTAIQRKEVHLSVTDDQARSLRNVLLQRAYDQRNTSEGMDYSDLAERIDRDLDHALPPEEVAEDRALPRDNG